MRDLKKPRVERLPKWAQEHIEKLEANATRVPCLFTDRANISYGFDGVKFHFGLGFPENLASIPDHTLVGMSAEFAADFHALLGRTLKDYKRKYGAIRPLPPAEPA